MHAVGLSMALGTFLAGVLLAESEYRRELETDLEPFKGLLLGLFFIAVGMSIDFAVVLASPWRVALVVLGFLAVKSAMLLAMARAMDLPLAGRPLFTVLLAQGGEFGFVVFQAATQAGVIDAATVVVAAGRGGDLDVADTAGLARRRPRGRAAAGGAARGQAEPRSTSRNRRR